MRVTSGVLLALAVSVCLLAGAQKRPGPTPPSRDPIVIDAQGYRDLLARQRGKPLLVNFWATWCEPCREEYPMVNELARKFASQGLVVIGVSLDDDGEITLVRRFLARTRPVFSNYRKRPGNEQAFIETVNPQWSGAIPATFFYAPDGRETKRLVGEHTRAEFEEAIRALLQRGSSSSSAPEARGQGRFRCSSMGSLHCC